MERLPDYRLDAPEASTFECSQCSNVDDVRLLFSCDECGCPLCADCSEDHNGLCDDCWKDEMCEEPEELEDEG